jgi:hypothetical protein
VAQADDDSVNGHSTVNETGTFDYNWWYGTSGSGSGFSFAAADVNTVTGDVVIGENFFDVREMRATSPGWTLTISASDFNASGGFQIDKSNLSLTTLWLNPGHQNCLGVLAPLRTPSRRSRRARVHSRLTSHS